MAVRETGKRVISDSEVVRACARIGGEVYDTLLKSALKSRANALVGARLLFKIEGHASSSPPRDSANRAAPCARSPLQADELRLAASSAILVLRTAELQRIVDGLNRAQEEHYSANPRGYWLSKNWMSQARRYCEASRARLLSNKEHQPTSHQRRARGRSRSSSSESLPPWPDANADLLCTHGAFAPRSVPRAKRVLVDRATWRAIACRFPHSTKLKASAAAECRVCLGVLEDRAKQKARQRSLLEDERQRRISELDGLTDDDQPRVLAAASARAGKVQDEFAKPTTPSGIRGELASPTLPTSISGRLRGLLSRERAKRGVPSHRVSAEAVAANRRGARVSPLGPGRYHLVPRAWMQAWRASLRNASLPRPGPPPTANCLCVAHGRPLVPPDLASYLGGELAHVKFPQLPTSTTSEIVDAEEWQALNALFPVDFAVAFDITPDISDNFLELHWLTEPCRLCDASGTAQDLDLKFRPRDAKRLGKHRYQEDEAFF